MKRSRAMAGLGLLGFVSTLGAIGCGSSAPQSSGAPGEASGRSGTLVARVAGNPRDIRYFINGKHFETDYEIEWWRDARLEVELAPGAYQVEAEYVVRAFAGDRETYRISAPEPVEVRAGQVTLLYANLSKDYRGVPKNRTEIFSVLHPTPSPLPETDPAAAPRRAPGAASRSDQPLDTIMIRRTSVSQSVEPTIPAAPENAASLESWRIRSQNVERGAAPAAALVQPDGGDAIQVHGSQVRQGAAPEAGPPRDANTPPQSIEIRGTRVTQSAAPARREAPGSDAPAESIRIRGTQVDVTPAP